MEGKAKAILPLPPGMVPSSSMEDMTALESIESAETSSKAAAILMEVG